MRTNNSFMFIFTSQHDRHKQPMPNLPRPTTCCPATEVSQKSPQIHQLKCKAEEKFNTEACNGRGPQQTARVAAGSGSGSQ